MSSSSMADRRARAGGRRRGRAPSYEEDLDELCMKSEETCVEKSADRPLAMDVL